jgi:anaerobic ribonucleoside-triphosphate reductase activating protein
MNYANIKNCDIANGLGVRVSLFVSGCTHHCPGCFNQIAWDFNYGKDFNKEVQDKIIELLSPSYIDGFSILGGEPLSDFNLDKVLDLAKSAKEVQPEKDIWLWTGYVIDDALSNEKKAEKVKKILKYVDVIIDGPFVQELKDVAIRYRGSTNQRILRVHHKEETDTPFFEDITENTNLY